MVYSSFPSSPQRAYRNIFGKRSRNRKIKILSALIMTGFVFFIAGLLGLVIAFGVVAKDLPSPNKLKTRDVELSTKIFDRNGELLYDIYGDQNRTLVTLDKVPKDLQHATLAIEDKNFYKHEGFDFLGIGRAFMNVVINRDFSGGGGSTLTQQLVKNALLSNEQTFIRKFKELILALLIEQKYTKDEILQMYLNEVPYGGTAAGIEAASYNYFGKSVKDLTLVESAVLSGLPQKPTTYSPFGSNPDAYITRTKDVLRRMREDGYITKDQEEQAKNEIEGLKFAQQGGNIRAPHFVMYVREELVKRFGEKTVLTGGLQVTTSLDLKVQDKVQEAVTKELSKPEYQRLKVGNGAAVVQDPKTGEVLAMVGSMDYFNTEKDGNYNVATALRQPGSSIKPINYVTGFKKGYTPATMFIDKETEFSNGEGQPPYKPRNYDSKFHGPVQIRYALGNSYNLPAVKMLYTNGVKEMLTTAKDMGINTLTDESRYGLSLTLGGGEVKLLELTNAYSVFANGGVRVDPVSILRVVSAQGKVLEEYKQTKGRQVLAPEHAYLINDILSDQSAKYDAFGVGAATNILGVKGHKVAAKTGTTDDIKDNWTMGYTASYTVGVWTGNNDGTPMASGLVSGITGAAPIWHSIMVEVLKDKKLEEFTKPAGIVQMEIDKVSGMKPGPYSEKRTEYFAKWQVPQREDDMHKKIRICKPTGKLVTDSCPPEEIEEKVFLVLYDPVTKQSCDPCPPGDSDTSYYNPTGKEEPLVSISKPDPGDNLKREFEVVADIKSPYTLTKVEFMFDNIVVATSTTPPFQYTYTVDKGAPAGKHTISVKATDSAGNVGADEVEIALLD